MRGGGNAAPVICLNVHFFTSEFSTFLRRAAILLIAPPYCAAMVRTRNGSVPPRGPIQEQCYP